MKKISFLFLLLFYSCASVPKGDPVSRDEFKQIINSSKKNEEEKNKQYHKIYGYFFNQKINGFHLKRSFFETLVEKKD